MGTTEMSAGMNGNISEGGTAVRLQPCNPILKAIHTSSLPFLTAVLLASLASLSLSALGEPASRVPERLLVKPRHTVAEATLQSVFAAHGATQVEAIPQINVRILRVPEARWDRVMDSLKHNQNFEFVEPDILLSPAATPNDPYYSVQWHLPKIAAPTAWDTSSGSTNIVIAILDSGVDGSHPDLPPQFV